MSEIYKVDMLDRVTDTGISCILDHGEAVELGSMPYVKTPGGWLQPRREGWHDTPEAAWQAAAKLLDTKIARLTQQRDRWQEGRA
jgi:hypothetical protein